MLKMNLGIEILYCPIMMPTIQDKTWNCFHVPGQMHFLALTQLPWQVRQMSDLLSCPSPMLPWDKKIGHRPKTTEKP